jgi:hypothetical protein
VFYVRGNAKAIPIPPHKEEGFVDIRVPDMLAVFRKRLGDGWISRIRCTRTRRPHSGDRHHLRLEPRDRVER